MTINIENYKDANFSDWQNKYNMIYGHKNIILQPRLMWLKVIGQSAKIAEGIRKRNFNDVAIALAKTFQWICIFVSNNQDLLDGASIEDMIWNKYPRVCGHCAPNFSEKIKNIIETRGGISCNCDPKNIEKLEHKMPAPLTKYKKLKNKPTSLDKWAEMFEAIYGYRVSLMSLDPICFHYMEEVGEVLYALRTYTDFISNFPKGKYTKKKALVRFGREKIFEDTFKKERPRRSAFITIAKQSVKNEIADVISWLFSLISKLITLKQSFSDLIEYSLDRQLEQERRFLEKMRGIELTLSSILYLSFIRGCPICGGREKCRCDKYIAPYFIFIKNDV